MKSSEPTSRIYATLKAMGRTAKVKDDGEVIFTDGQPAPSAEAWSAALAANKARKVISRERFLQCLTTSEKHDVFRRASLAAGNSPAAPEFAALMFWLITADRIASDDAALSAALNLMEATGMINRTRRNRIAEFKRPAN